MLMMQARHVMELMIYDIEKEKLADISGYLMSDSVRYSKVLELVSDEEIGI